MAAGDGAGVLWRPPADVGETTEIGRYVAWLARERGLSFATYEELQRWSVDDLAGFWASIWDFFEVKAHAPYSAVLSSDEMPGATWFPGARLNLAEHLVGADDDADTVAIISHSQTRAPSELTFGEFREQVARARAGSSGWASARATAWSPTCRASPRRSSRSRRPPVWGRCGPVAPPSSARAA